MSSDSKPRIMVVDDELEMAAMLAGEQAQVGIGRKRRMIVDRERDEWIVLGLDEQRGDPDALQELIRRLGRVVIVGGAKAERHHDGRDAGKVARLLLNLVFILAAALLVGDRLIKPRTQPSELADRDWRADPADGMRPLRHIRAAWEPAP